MITDFNLQILIEPLLNWFAGMPVCFRGQEEPTPNRVWVSEIMLQQTRVEAVKPYFERFTKRLPDVEALAECPEDELLKLWEGLGYYNRVRNMQKAAIQVMEEHGGKLPADYEKLLKLKGDWKLHCRGDRLHCISDSGAGCGWKCIPHPDESGCGRYRYYEAVFSYPTGKRAAGSHAGNGDAGGV